VYLFTFSIYAGTNSHEEQRGHRFDSHPPLISRVYAVVDLEGAEPAPPTPSHFGRQTNAVTHGHVSLGHRSPSPHSRTTNAYL